MMLLRSQSILYFNVKRTIWLKGHQNGNHIEPSEQRLQEISIFLACLFLAAVVLTEIILIKN